MYSIVANGVCASTKLIVPMVGSMDECMIEGVESESSVETLSGENAREGVDIFDARELSLSPNIVSEKRLPSLPNTFGSMSNGSCDDDKRFSQSISK